MTSNKAGALDTFPKLLLEQARVRPHRTANREKDCGIWQSWSWAEVAAEVEAFACGLAAMGFLRGDKLAIIGDNRPRLYWAIAATQALGGVPVPIYQDSIAEEMAFVLDHADSSRCFATAFLRTECSNALHHVCATGNSGQREDTDRARVELHDRAATGP